MSKSIHNRGFTIIELICSLAIVGILSIAFSPLFVFIIKTSDLSKEKYHATLIAQSHFEELKGSDSIPENQEGILEGDYRINIISQDIPEYSGKLYKIRVEVLKGEKVIENIEGLKRIKN